MWSERDEEQTREAERIKERRLRRGKGGSGPKGRREREKEESREQRKQKEDIARMRDRIKIERKVKEQRPCRDNERGSQKLREKRR